MSNLHIWKKISMCFLLIMLNIHNWYKIVLQSKNFLNFWFECSAPYNLIRRPRNLFKRPNNTFYFTSLNSLSAQIILSLKIIFFILGGALNFFYSRWHCKFFYPGLSFKYIFYSRLCFKIFYTRWHYKNIFFYHG